VILGDAGEYSSGELGEVTLGLVEPAIARDRELVQNDVDRSEIAPDESAVSSIQLGIVHVEDALALGLDRQAGIHLTHLVAVGARQATQSDLLSMRKRHALRKTESP
jgi:hypothetical protein